MENKEILLSILEQLEKLNTSAHDLYYKEWFPITFQFYAKGQYIRDPHFGSSKWGFKKLNLANLTYDFDYEFHSLYAHTENRQYNSAFKLVINDVPYPNIERIASEYSNYDNWQEFVAHNYCYERPFRFCRIVSHQSNHGHADYPFEMVVKKPWDLNFEFFQTSTSNYWHFLQIHGWKLHSVNKKFIKELEGIIN